MCLNNKQTSVLVEFCQFVASETGLYLPNFLYIVLESLYLNLWQVDCCDVMMSV